MPEQKIQKHVQAVKDTKKKGIIIGQQKQRRIEEMQKLIPAYMKGKIIINCPECGGKGKIIVNKLVRKKK